MRTIISVIALVVCSGISVATVKASPLDGVWRNKEERILLQIESTRDGIRTKRTDQDAWDYYRSDRSNRYTDSNGNSYEVIGENEIVWRINRTGKRITLLRMYKNDPPVLDRPSDTGSRDRSDGGGDSRTGNRDDDWYEDDRWEDNDRYRERPRGDYGTRSRYAGLTGTWFNQKTRHSMYVQSVPNGLRISTGRAKPMLFAPSRDSKVFRSRNGDTLTWLNNHTLQLKTNGRQNLIFHRADETSTKGKGHGHGKAKGHDKAHGHGKAHGHHK